MAVRDESRAYYPAANFDLRVFDKGGNSGYGECVAGANPFFNHETVDTAWLIATRYVPPLLAAARVESAAQVSHALAQIRENRMAKAGVEAAIWDLEAKIAQAPLWQHIKGTRDEISCGVSIGLQSATEALLDKVSREVESGYQRIKIKIKPGKDVQLVEAIQFSAYFVRVRGSVCLFSFLGSWIGRWLYTGRETEGSSSHFP